MDRKTQLAFDERDESYDEAMMLLGQLSERLKAGALSEAEAGEMRKTVVIIQTHLVGARAAGSQLIRSLLDQQDREDE